MENTIPVSVIVPVYNSKEWIADCINSINQGVMPDEIIVIDDCSTDGSYEYVNNLLNDHQNIKLLKTYRNGGAAEARRVGFNAAINDLVAIVDADDILEKDALCDAYHKITDKVDMCIWDLWRLHADGSISRTHNNPVNLPVGGEHAAGLSLGEWRIHPLGVARKALYLAAYEELTVASLWADELISRLVLLKTRMIVGSVKKYYYRDNPKSSTQKVSGKHFTRLRSEEWLIGFSKKIGHPSQAKIIKSSIAVAYGLWQDASIINPAYFIAELRLYIKKTMFLGAFWRVVLLSPKHLIAYIVLLIICATGVVTIGRGRS